MATDWNSLSASEFRAEIASFVDTHCPPALRYLQRRPRWAQVKPWYCTLACHGRLAPGWPVEYGGMGLRPARHLLYIEEMERCGAPWMPDSGVRNLGPVLIAHGDPVQKRIWLPGILSGDQVWCQGYSESGAGSDLASLRTSARLDGSDFVITGNKIWTTAAFDATHMFALVRTDPVAVKQAGISFLLIDMNQPGVTVRPILNIAGEEEFCEVFLDGARAPRSNMIGGLHQGWKVAQSLLGFERVWAGSPRKAMAALWRIEELARRTNRLLDQAFIDRLTQATFDVHDLSSLYERFAQMLRAGGLGSEVSALKIWATETCQRVCELLIETAGDHGILLGDTDAGEYFIEVLLPFFDSRTPTIFSGTNQIQRNIVAKHILDLPS